jgi:hypothetical protein
MLRERGSLAELAAIKAQAEQAYARKLGDVEHAMTVTPGIDQILAIQQIDCYLQMFSEAMANMLADNIVIHIEESRKIDENSYRIPVGKADLTLTIDGTTASVDFSPDQEHQFKVDHLCDYVHAKNGNQIFAGNHNETRTLLMLTPSGEQYTFLTQSGELEKAK